MRHLTIYFGWKLMANPVQAFTIFYVGLTLFTQCSATFLEHKKSSKKSLYWIWVFSLPCYNFYFDLGKAFWWFSREVFELQTNLIQFEHPNFKSFHMSIFTLTKSIADMRQKNNFELFIWPKEKNFASENFFFNFTKSLPLCPCFKPWRGISIAVLIYKSG